ncbi:hypothetical protein QBC46DRAFT_452120 [Diplogelasinospora grovesii]|uniref:Autophagy-related protein 28 n=1 Tax=Diplogelasinospora grovesii TaxID=303347 RepID=A0AAN6S1N4_9PEZI|nr:hypothetical protein QBC46DRAFT_452120 [Diplogelasinospora grovesii]
MAAKSPFFPRLSFSSRNDAPPILPSFHHHHRPGTPPLRKKPSEYDLAELSPQPDDALLSGEPGFHNNRRRPSPPASSARYSDSTAGSASKMKQPSRVLFSGPPPPIAASRVLYRDEEEGTHNHSHPTSASVSPRLEASSFARNINSVLFDRGSSSQIRNRDTRHAQDYEPDAVWRNLQRREKALQKELQHLLDVQSAGLAAHLDPNAPPSETGSSTPTGTSFSGSTRRKSHVAFDQHTSGDGEVMPVRQPRHKPLGLRGARAALARNMTLLADLKSEEDANLTSALSVRKKALTQLRKLSTQRDGIQEELRALESDKDEPLARELRELTQEQQHVSAEIRELEERLHGLKSRKKWLDTKVHDVRNRREAGLSGYRGALKEAESRVSTLLTKPPVKPLDLEAISPPPPNSQPANANANADGVEGQHTQQSPGGTEFLRLRPERRTVDMAREWWENEVVILERRKGEVDRDRKALEEGVEVWKETTKLVGDFERGLRDEMNGGDDMGKGKDIQVTPEQAMHRQLDKMGAVMAGLQEKLRIAEERGWNLLICAIGAELEAFKEAEGMLRGALRAAGFLMNDAQTQHDLLPDHDDGQQHNLHDEVGVDEEEEATRTPLGRSVYRLNGSGGFGGGFGGAGGGGAAGVSDNGAVGGAGDGVVDGFHDGNAWNDNHTNLMDLQDHIDKESSTEPEESDNEVPSDLLIADHNDPEDPEDDSFQGQETLVKMTSRHSHESSENEVPPEFLAEHDPHALDDVE